MFKLGFRVLAVVLLAVPGCVELTGQRISWFHDEEKDELLFVVHYDGIHEATTNSRKGEEQIPEFVRNGDVMFLDWPFHVEMSELRQTAARAGESDAQNRDWAQLHIRLEATPIGFYREPDGRVGAAQLVRIRKVSQFVDELNRVFSAGMQKQEIDAAQEGARTLKRMKEAAAAGHRWVRLDGQTIRLQSPVHPGEWARFKGQALQGFVETVLGALGAGAEQNKQEGLRVVMFMLSSAPVSYIDHGDRVEFILGQSDKPNTFRFPIRDEYEPSLEPVVKETVKINLDEVLAEALLNEGDQPSEGVSLVLRAGPPEEPVRALMHAAKEGDPSRRSAAMERLNTWAADWNREYGVPPAPAKTDGTSESLSAWTAWYSAMRAFPFDSKDPWANVLEPDGEVQPVKASENVD
jgi:hypothetical protein